MRIKKITKVVKQKLDLIKDKPGEKIIQIEKIETGQVKDLIIFGLIFSTSLQQMK